MSDKNLIPITDTKALHTFCDALAQGDFLCIDTEFHREQTYWPELCLIQASAPNIEGMIDPLAEGLDLTPFLDLIKDRSRVKVLHAARQDLEIFHALLGEPLGPIFDTQIGAMALGLGDSISYDNLIQRVLNLHIDKSSQFTNWLGRPLTEKQLAYALGDVTHLRDAYYEMKMQLEVKGRLGWLAEDMARLEASELYDNRAEHAWQKLKIRKSKPDYLAVLANVAAWRETRAKALNRPRRRIMKDDTIYEIALQKPRHEAEYEQLRSLQKGFMRSKYADGLKEMVDQALASPKQYAPILPVRKQNAHLPGGVPEMLKVLLKCVSEDASIVPRLIANAADIERIARGETEDIPALTGWRYEIFGQHAQALMSGQLALSLQDNKIRLFKTPPDQDAVP